MTLSKYTVELQEDRKHLREVSNPFLADTPFRSPQMRLFDIAPHEWMLYWRTPPYAPARRKHRVQGIVQWSLFEVPAQEKAAGANGTDQLTQSRSCLHLVSKQSNEQEPSDS